MNTEVLIIGAGPTGLMAANQLMRFGIDFIIIDLKAGPTRESRAIAVTARSMEIYQQMGLSQNAVEGGARINSLSVFLDGRPKVEVTIGTIGEGLSEFNYLLAFEQSKNEELLSRNLADNSREVQWNTEFIRLKAYKDGIEAVVKKNGNEFNITAEYLIACDGARSPVRHQLDFSFTGGTYEHKFFVADTILTWPLDYDKLVITPGRENFCGFLPMKGERSYRVLGTLPAAYFNKKDIAFNDIQEVVINTLGIPVSFDKVNWFSTYLLHHRGVDQFGKGRVYLAGDSAHIHSPAGGQGMNTGLQDAYNLCWKLSLVLKGHANPKLLDTYNEERVPFAKWLLNFTDRAFSIMTSSNWLIAAFRKYIVLNIAGIAVRSKWLRPRLFNIVSQIRYSYSGMSLSRTVSRQKLLFKAGERLPYFSGSDYYLRFTAAAFHLLHIGNNALTDEQQKEVNDLFPFPVKTVENKLDEHWKKLGMKDELFILVRPDNYMAYICDSFDKTALDDYLNRYFGQPS